MPDVNEPNVSGALPGNDALACMDEITALRELVQHASERLESIEERWGRSRETALVATKLDEADLWAQRRFFALRTSLEGG